MHPTNWLYASSYWKAGGQIDKMAMKKRVLLPLFCTKNPGTPTNWKQQKEKRNHILLLPSNNREYVHSDTLESIAPLVKKKIKKTTSTCNWNHGCQKLDKTRPPLLAFPSHSPKPQNVIEKEDQIKNIGRRIWEKQAKIRQGTIPRVDLRDERGREVVRALFKIRFESRFRQLDKIK